MVLCVVMTFLCFAGRKTTAMASGGDEEWEEFFNDETVAALVKEAESSLADDAALTAEGTTEAGQTDNQSDTQADNSGLDNSAAGNSGSDNASGNTSGNDSGSGNQAAQPGNLSDGSSDSQGGNTASDTPANTTFKADGTYARSAVCDPYGYDVTVTIVVSGDVITSVTATSEAGAQDVQYFNMANAKVPAQLLANQSTSGVDSVTGATKSSNAIKKAFYYAYKSAKK